MRLHFPSRVSAAATLSVSLAFVGLALAGCKGIPTANERVAREELSRVSEAYQPTNRARVLPALNPHAGLSDFVQFAVLNSPQVKAAYFDWAKSVERITVERSLPDPRLTFESDIADIVMSLMPGLMMEFPGPGKLKAAANVASAESEGKYFAFEWNVLQTAFALKKAYYELHFLNAKVVVNREMLRLMGEIERLARVQNEAGKVTLQDVLRAQIEQERITTEIANLEDSRNPLLTQFKAALGLNAEDAAPSVPSQLESTPLDLTSERLFATALVRNPRLKAMESDVRRAEASLRLAYKGRVPDIMLGLDADAKAAPTIFTPQIGITLPIWRDKIAAQIAEAQAGKRAAEARLTSEQIMLAVDFAMKTFMFREASRNLELLEERLLPKARQSLEVAQTGYTGGRVDFLSVLDAERTLLQFQLSEVEARVQRELALAELSLLILGTPPANAPVLPPKTISQTRSEP